MLKTLIKLRILEMFSGMRAKNGKSLGVAGMIILMFFVGVSMLFLFGSMAFALALGLSVAGLNWFYFGLMAIMVFMLSFIGTVFMTKQQMFEAKDNSALLSMPIKPRDILLSRVLSIGLMNYVLAFLVAIPFGIVYAILVGFSIPGAIFYLIGIIILPLFALACSMLFGWLLAVLNKKMKHKNIFTMAFSTIFMVAYFYLCFSWQNRIEELVQHGDEVAAALSRYLPPVYHFGNAVAKGNLLSFLIFAAICLIPFAVVITLVSKHFVGIVTTEVGAAKIEYKGGAMKTSSEFMSLASVELKRLTSSTMYMLNAGTGLMFVLMLAVVAIVKKGEAAGLIEKIGPMSQYIGVGLVFAMLYLCSFTIISAGTISLEGKTLWLPKSLPVDAKNVLLAKAYPHIAVSLPITVLACILLQFAFDMSVVSRIMLVLLPAITTVFNAFLGVIVNLNLPKFNWINEAQAIKQGMAPFLAMVLSAIPAIIFVLLAILAGVTGIISMDVYMIIFFVLMIIGTFLLYRWIGKKGVMKFWRLQNN